MVKSWPTNPKANQEVSLLHSGGGANNLVGPCLFFGGALFLAWGQGQFAYVKDRKKRRTTWYPKPRTLNGRGAGKRDRKK